jgi:phage I-like protein
MRLFGVRYDDRMKQPRDSQKRIAFVQLFAEGKSSTVVPDEIQIVPCGKWSHPVYGEMEITPADITEFVQNYTRGVRLDIPITQGHDNGMSGGELPAVCWFTELMDRGQAGLFGKTKWTEEGKQLLTSGTFKYFSPEFYEQYTDPETGLKFGHVLVGGALTNKPYFKELQPVVAAFSEPEIMSKFIDTMNIKDIVAKKASELSTEEKDFLRTHKEELNDDQKTAFKSVFDEDGGAGAGGEEEPKDEPKEEPKDEPKVEGSEVKISATEYALLKDKADKGQQAFSLVETMKLETEVSKLVFSETNKEGKVLPKQKDSVVSFMKTLSEKQRDQFRNIVNNLPKADAKMFGELGDGGKTVASTKAEEVKGLVDEKIKASEGKLSFSKALSEVMKENPQLASEYNAEMNGGEDDN